MEGQPGRRGLRSLAAWTGVAGAVLVGACLAPRPAEPALADPPLVAARAEWARAAAAEAGDLLTSVLESLEQAIQHGREGTARTVAGDADPQEEYLAAANALDATAADADRAAIAVAHLRGIIEALGNIGSVTPLGVSGGDLSGIAGQLREAAAAAGPFVAIRRSAQATLVALGEALAALDRDDLPGALAALDRATAARTAVATWEDAPLTLPFWLETTADLIDALQRLIAATTAGDQAAAEAAAAAYADATDEAHQADLALAISISEAGSGVARTPLRRLTAAAAAVTQARFEVASVGNPS